MGRRKDERARSVGRGKRGDWREGEHTWGEGVGELRMSMYAEDPKKCPSSGCPKRDCDEMMGNQKEEWKAQPNGQGQRAQGTGPGRTGLDASNSSNTPHILADEAVRQEPAVHLPIIAS